MNNQKGLSSLLIVVLIALAVSGYFLYLKNISQNQKKPTPELSTQISTIAQDKKNIGSIEKDEKTGEQLYKNNILNYSIKVPKNWIIKDNPGVFVGIPGEAFLYYPGQNSDSYSRTGIGIFAAKYKAGPNLSYEGDFNQALNEKSSLGEGKNVFKIDNLKIAGQNAVQFVQKSLPGDPTETFYSVKTWMVYKDMNYYFVFSGDEDFIKQNLKLYNNILSTFEFLDQNPTDTSNWKTYTNAKYGYYIKYPESWIVNESDLNGVNILGMGKGSEGGFTYGGQSVMIHVSKSNSTDEDHKVEYIKDNVAPNNSLTKLGYVTINNYSGRKWSFNNNEEDDNYTIIFSVDKNDYFLIKELSNKSQFKDYDSEIDQVISTFKLTR